MKRKTIHVAAGDLSALIPSGVDIPATVTVQGLTMTGEQAAVIPATQRGDLTIQTASRGRVAVRNPLMPVGVWAVFERDGSFDLQPRAYAATQGRVIA